MVKNLLLFVTVLSYSIAAAQVFDPGPPFPEKISNNAVTSTMINGQRFVYSFSGIDSTKRHSGIHNRVYQFSVETNQWHQLADLPTGSTRIAAAASAYNDKVYILGGYHVDEFGFETTLDNVHHLQGVSGLFQEDAPQLPKRVDDHVQAVWRDSLIFVITGWSTNRNVPDVQIFNMEKDTWQQGTPVPETTDYEVFGASGVIIGDTIYYLGGAEFGFNFPASNFFRKGAINPDEPTEITWSGFESPDAVGYRSAALAYDGRAYWIGGSDVTYNFDGIAYNGSGGVEPNRAIVIYDPSTGKLERFENLAPLVMDLRGVGQISNDAFLLVGGFTKNQEVTDQTWIFRPELLSATDNSINLDVRMYPNPASEYLIVDSERQIHVVLTDMQGRNAASTKSHVISLTGLPAGVYMATLLEDGRAIGVKKLIIIH